MSGSKKFEEYVKKMSNIEFKVSGSNTIKLDDTIIKISGSGSLEGNVLKVAGSGRILGSINIGNINVSGSFLCDGLLTATEVHSAGSFKVTKNVKAEILRSSGSCKIDGDIDISQKLSSAGSFKAHDIKARIVEVSGSILLNNANCETLKISGAIRGKQVRSRNFLLKMHGDSELEKLVSDFIEIRPCTRGYRGFSIRLFGKEILGIGNREARGIIRVNKIIGKKIYLENTDCDEISGDEVIIGPNCVIRKNIYYKDKFQIDPTSKLYGKAVKVERIEEEDSNS